MGRREMDSDEEALFDSARISTEKHQCKTTPIVISSPHLETGFLVDNCSLEKPYWPQSYESSMNLYSRSPLIDTDTCAMEPSLAPGLNNVVPSCKLHQYNELSGDADEPLLRSNEHWKVSPNGDSEDHRGKNQFTVNSQGHLVLHNSQGHLVLHNSRDHLSSLEIRRSSFFQAVLNGINILAGVGILSMPYAISQGGWIGLSFLLIFAVICCYTGILLRRCIDLDPSIVGYPDVGQVAFGTYGRIIVSVLLYFELFAVAAEFLILEGDNLTQLIAWKGIKLKYFELTPEQSFIIISSIVMLPTVWLRDLRLLSYISAGGVIACVTVFVATSWFGISDSGFTYQSGNLVNIQGLPIAVGLYAFCYCGHAVFPSIYCSMKDKTKFTHVLVLCFAFCTLLYGGMAMVGYLIFGESAKSQITLNLPRGELSTQVAIIAMLVNPFAKYALTLTPVAAALEEFLPHEWKTKNFEMCGVIIRSLLVASTVGIAIAIPFFVFIMALVGSFLSVTVAIIIPCICYLKLFSHQIVLWEKGLILCFLVFGLIACIAGTYTSVMEIVNRLSVM